MARGMSVNMSEKELRVEIIKVGKRLYAAGLAVAKSGNLSARLDNENILRERFLEQGFREIRGRAKPQF